MNRIVIVNDVHSDMELSGLLVGRDEVPPSKQGLKDSVIISDYLSSTFDNISQIVASNDTRVSRILHYLRLHAHRNIKVYTSDALCERDFGVLSGSNPQLIGGFDSDIFTHSRICPESGESVSQCRNRLVPYVRSTTSGKDGTSIILSHSFACQIIFNVFMNQDITHLSDFWMKKGSISVFNITDDYPWGTYDTSYNILEAKRYCIDEPVHNRGKD